jgi:hypothetical protein
MATDGTQMFKPPRHKGAQVEKLKKEIIPGNMDLTTRR